MIQKTVQLDFQLSTHSGMAGNRSQIWLIDMNQAKVFGLESSNGRIIQELSFRSPPVALSCTDHWLVVGLENGTVHSFQLNSMEEKRQIVTAGSIYELALLEEDKIIIWNKINGDLEFWQGPIRLQAFTTSQMLSLTCSTNSMWWIDQDFQISILDLKKFEIISTPFSIKEDNLILKFCANVLWLGRSESIQLIDQKTLLAGQNIPHDLGPIKSLVCDELNRLILLGSQLAMLDPAADAVMRKIDLPHEIEIWEVMPAGQYLWCIEPNKSTIHILYNP